VGEARSALKLGKRLNDSKAAEAYSFGGFLFSRWYNLFMPKTHTFTLVGNWKMNPDTLADAEVLFKAISRKAAKAPSVAVVIAPPAPFLVSLASRKSDVSLSTQDVSAEERGAFTGSISALEVKSAGAQYVIIGHSERRKAGDTDEIIGRKVSRAVEAGLKVILCVGEKERDQEAKYLREIREQILADIGKIDQKKASSLMIAYEPMWAIGKSYDTALSPRDIHEMTIYIRKVASEVLGKSALKLKILYGGSVNFENAQAILKEAEIDGLLVGRQSLDPENFGAMLEYAHGL
jgi:triosephosphate isomerase (TIM)